MTTCHGRTSTAKKPVATLRSSSVASLVAWMDRSKIERASVVGHSMGGLVAAGLAAEAPERVDRLILVDAAFRTSVPSVFAAVASQLARLTNQPPTAIPPFTSRPPLAPTPLRLLARDPGAHLFDDDPESGSGRSG